MNNNQKVIRKPEETWLCKNCHESIIPFNKAGKTTIIEGIIFLAGVGLIFVFNLFFGVILIALSAIIWSIRTSKKSTVCPVCESVEIIPSTSPAAQNYFPKSRPRRAR